jgi:REP-associated tyrosine transposase
VSVLTFTLDFGRRAWECGCVPRPLRIEYAGAIYHVMNRGDHRDDIFGDDEDRQRFLSTLGQACQKTEWQVHAYCLMRNHFHLVIETPQPNLVAGMKWLLGVYTKRYNIRHKLCGHLFAGRYKALHVDGSGTGYLRTVCDYVHLNPVRARLVKAKAPLESFEWSSYGAYIGAPGWRPEWLRVDRLLGEHRIPRDNIAGRREFAAQMEERRQQETETDYRHVRRGWCFGDEEFRKELTAAAFGRAGPSHHSARRHETQEAKAEAIVKEGLKQIGWSEGDLASRPKGAKGKVAVARRLRKETTMSLKWIATRLEMGTWTYVSNLVNTKHKTQKEY